MNKTEQKQTLGYRKQGVTRGVGKMGDGGQLYGDRK